MLGFAVLFLGGNKKERRTGCSIASHLDLSFPSLSTLEERVKKINSDRVTPWLGVEHSLTVILLHHCRDDVK